MGRKWGKGISNRTARFTASTYSCWLRKAGGWGKYQGEREMDVGKKCLLMAVVGVILAVVSSPFVINMVFTGKLITVFTGREVLEPSVLEYPLSPRIINSMERIGMFYFNPERGEQYRISLNVVTNGTINVLIFRTNSTGMIQNSFNAGNHTIEDLMITDEGVYIFNATNIGNNAVNATFRIKESWLVRLTEWEEQIDLLRTVMPAAGFAAGIIMLAYSLIKLRSAR